MDHVPRSMNRRHFITKSAIAGAAAATAPATLARAGTPGDAFEYEVQRTDAEWRAMFTDFEHKILRRNGTELPHTSALANETADGTYHCRGCDLPVFSSNWKVPLDKGWVFFAHAMENAVLTSVDGPQEAYGMDPNGFNNLVEVHCRRCGSHLGHLLIVEKQLVFCINGTALNFVAAAA